MNILYIYEKKIDVYMYPWDDSVEKDTKQPKFVILIKYWGRTN